LLPRPDKKREVRVGPSCQAWNRTCQRGVASEMPNFEAPIYLLRSGNSTQHWEAPQKIFIDQ
jgi:hypothetical protein